MAIAIRQEQHRVVHRAPWVRRRGGESDAVLATLMLALLMGGAIVVAASLAAPTSSSVFSLRALLPNDSTARPRDGTVPRVGAADIAPASAATMTTPASVPDVAPAAPDEAPTSEVSLSPWQPRIGEPARVAHTDGLGVVLHAAPSTGARLPAGLLEGTRVTVLDVVGTEWVQVQTDTRRTGWVPAAFLGIDG
jgi:hypothetical protein